MPSRLGRVVSFLPLCCLILIQTSFGQEADTTQLPEIAPREIEIRGERQIALPSLERQPLQGFAPSTTLPAVPTDHEPYVAPYNQQLEEMPESLPVPETVSEPLTPGTDPIRGYAEAGGGRYLSRFAEARLAVPLSGHETISAGGEYEGTEGFTPSDRSDVQTPSDEVSADLRFDSRREQLHTTAELFGSARKYTLYGAVPASPSVLAVPEREGYRAGGRLRLRTRGSVPAMLQVTYDHTNATTQFLSDVQEEMTENRLDLRGSVTLPIASLAPELEARYVRSDLGEDFSAHTPFRLNVGGTIQLFDVNAITVRAGPRVLAVDAPTSASSPFSSQESYVVPALNAEWRGSDAVTLRVRNAPQLADGSLHTLYLENPYVQHAPILRPTVETTNAEAELTYASGPVRLTISGGYRYSPTFQYLASGGDPRYSDGIFRAAYASARILHGGGHLSIQGSETVQASVGISLRDGQLTASNTAIPNFASVTADGMLSVAFAGGRGLLRANAQFVGSRYTSTAETTRLDPYFSLDLEGSYAVNSTIELVLRADRLAPGAPTRWQGYPQQPAQVTMGLRIRW